MTIKQPSHDPAQSAGCDLCKHLNLAFEAMLEYHAIARARYEDALLLSNTNEALALEAELSDSSEPIRRAAKELRDHEASHTRASVKTRHRLLRLVKPKGAPDAESFLLDRIGNA